VGGDVPDTDVGDMRDEPGGLLSLYIYICIY